MDTLEAINKRKSRRAYLPDPIDEIKIAVLESQIQEHNSRSGLTIEFLKDGRKAFSGITKSYGMFTGVRSLLLLKGPKNEPELKEKIGYYGEKLILQATKFELGTCWVGGTFKKSDIKIPDSEELVCVVPIGNTPKEEGLKERMIYKLARRKTKSIGEMLEAVGEYPDWLTAGMEAVQKAPSARNTQKVQFLYKSGKLIATVPDTSPFDYVDLGIAKLHFEAAAGGRFESGNGGTYIPQDEYDNYEPHNEQKSEFLHNNHPS